MTSLLSKKIVLKGILLLFLLGGITGGYQNPKNVSLDNSSIVSQVQAADSTTQSGTDSCKVVPTSAVDTKAEDFLNLIIKSVIVLEKMILGLNLPIVMFIGKFLSNDWIYLDGKMQEVMQTLWILVRNFVNIIFVLVLIAVAFMAVTGAGKDQSKYAVKTMLPKFVIALVVVNFSFLIGKVILDFGNLATTASFSIVNEVGSSLFGQGGQANEKTWSEKVFCYPDPDFVGPVQPNTSQGLKCLPKTFYLGFGEGPNSGKDQICKDPNFDQQNSRGGEYFVFGPSTETLKDVTISSSLFDARTAMFVYSYNIFRLGEVLNVDSKANSVTGVALNVIFSVIFAGLILLLNVGMLVAFAVRMVMIWLILIFSPIMALEIVFPDKIKGKIPFMKQGFLGTLTGLAFMPAICGFILSLGFLMYQALSNIMPPAGVDIPLGPMNLHIAGSPLPGFATVQQIVLALIMMIIVWKAVFAALKSNELVGKAVGRIEQFGNSIGKLGARSLTLIPIIPTGKGLTAPAALPQVVERLNTAVSSRAYSKGEEAIQAFPGLSRVIHGADIGIKAETINELKQLKKDNGLKNSEYVSRFVNLLDKEGTELFNHPESRKEVITLLETEKDSEKIKRLVERMKNSTDKINSDDVRTALLTLGALQQEDRDKVEHLSSSKTDSKDTSHTEEKPKVAETQSTQTVGVITLEPKMLEGKISKELKIELTEPERGRLEQGDKSVAAEIARKAGGRDESLQKTIQTYLEKQTPDEMKKLIKEPPKK